jgi:hypothetical protein
MTFHISSKFEFLSASAEEWWHHWNGRLSACNTSFCYCSMGLSHKFLLASYRGKAPRGVQAVKSGYALCTDTIEDLTDLNKFADILASLIGDYTIEKQAKWITYRLENIPRVVRTLSGPCPVDITLLTNEIIDSTSETPVRVTETAQSIQNNLFNTSWFVSFTIESHVTLNKTLRIVGIRAIAIPVTFKSKISQCTRCFQWHNTRICSRSQRYRICGSNNHMEDNYTTNCITATPHSCPANVADLLSHDSHALRLGKRGLHREVWRRSYGGNM